MSLQYDGTGVAEDFVTTETFMVFQPNQKIRLADTGYFKVYDDAGNEPVRPGSNPKDTYSLQIRALIPDEEGHVSESDPIPMIDPTTETIKLWEVVDDQSDDQCKSDLLIHVNNAQERNVLCTVIKLDKIFENIFGGKNGRIKVTYQRYKKSVYDPEESEIPYDATGPRYSPAMMQGVLDRLAALEAKPTSFANMFGTYLGDEDILEEDLTGLAPENFVRYEKHDLNTAAGITIIQPAKGAFYPDGLEILKMEPIAFTLTEATRADALNKLFFYSDTEQTVNSMFHISIERKNILTDAIIDMLLTKFGGSVTGQLIDITDTATTLLEKDVDYIIDDIDMTRTARTHSSSGVYRHIRFLTELNGQVLVSYRAFGGFIATKDIRAMNQSITNTREILNNTGLLTEEGLSKLPLMVQIIKRLRVIERYHNHFHAVEHRIFVKGAQGIHWFNFAAIYDVDWGLLLNNIHDLGHFRIHSMLRDWTYEFMIDADVTRDIKDALQIRVLSTNENNYDPISGQKKIIKRDNILARLCWVDEGERSGVVLQLGWDLSVYDPENYPCDIDVVSIINKSGSTSFWQLLTGPEVNQPAEGQIMVYNHTPFKLTGDSVVEQGKVYFEYKNRYLYFRTCDRYIKEGRGYYSLQNDGSYADVTGSVTPGDPVTNYTDDQGRVNLFERMVYGNYLTAADTVVGDQIPIETYYEPDIDVYKEDRSFTMPNTNFVWSYEDAVTVPQGSHSFFCVKPLCCEDGVPVWLGNVNLSRFAAGESTCKKCEGDYESSDTEETVESYKTISGLAFEYQDWIDISTVKSIDFVLFDRLDGKYIVKNGAVEKALYERETPREASIDYEPEDQFVGSVTLQLSASDQCWATLQMTKENGVIGLEVCPYLGTFSYVNNRFDLRQINLHF